MKNKLLWMLMLAFLLSWQLQAKEILQLHIEGVVGPAYSEYLKQGVAEAKKRDAELILLILDTPGGLMTSMREMIQTIANSPIPIATYVHPVGARAASAGTYLLYASPIAAMTPGTQLGAATPVQMGGIGPEAPRPMDSNQTGKTAMEKKVLHDAMATIRSLAQLYERNITWAEQAVQEGESLSATEALQMNVIDLLADRPHDLITQLHGREVSLADHTVVLDTEDSSLIPYDPDWKTELLATITQPNVAYIFLMIAMYGIFFELMNPGSIIPGVVGAISGVIALYALDMLPFSYAGLALMALGIAFMIGEMTVAGFGILGVGGAVAFAIGSLLLFDADTLGKGVSIPLVIALTLVSLGFFLLTVRLYFKGRSQKSFTGKEELIGSLAEVLHATDHGYLIWCHGEQWQARSEARLQPGEQVQVTHIDGLILTVQPQTKE